MTYELAKQLWDAKYPMSVNNSQAYEDPENPGMSISLPNPTLSELIAACGSNNMVFWSWYGTWYASKQPTQHWLEMEAQAEGTTPKEAVAKLWLALNAKPMNEPTIVEEGQVMKFSRKEDR